MHSKMEYGESWGIAPARATRFCPLASIGGQENVQGPENGAGDPGRGLGAAKAKAIETAQADTARRAIRAIGNGCVYVVRNLQEEHFPALSESSLGFFGCLLAPT